MGKNKIQVYAISRTFQNLSEFKPPMYLISIIRDLEKVIIVTMRMKINSSRKSKDGENQLIYLSFF